MVVKKLEAEKHAQIVNDAWKFRDDFSIEMVRGQIHAGFGFGVFSAESSDPVSWTIAYR